MSKINMTELKAYYSEISKAVVCPKKEKSAFLAELKSNVEEFISLTPEADIDMIKAEFGTAEQIASSFIVNADATAIKKKVDIRKLILIFLAIVLAVYLAFVVISLIDVHTEAHGYMQEGIMMINTFTGGELL